KGCVLSRALLGRKHGGDRADDVLDRRVAYVEREPRLVQTRSHVRVQLCEDTRPKRLGAGDRQALVGSDPEEIVQSSPDVAQMVFHVFMSRALVARLRPTTLILAPWDRIAEGRDLAQPLGRASKDPREPFVDERYTHATEGSNLGERSDER